MVNVVYLLLQPAARVHDLQQPTPVRQQRLKLPLRAQPYVRRHAFQTECQDRCEEDRRC